jgi:ribosome modulation factor
MTNAEILFRQEPEAYQKGFHAYHAGTPRWENPYVLSNQAAERLQWAHGWDVASAEE